MNNQWSMVVDLSHVERNQFQLDGVLGLPFIGKYRIAIDFGSRTVDFFNQGSDTDDWLNQYEQNGDLVPDPDMTFEIDPEHGTLEPLTIQHAIGRYYEVWDFNSDGTRKAYRPRLRAELNQFLRMWLTNLQHQGHTVHETKRDEIAA